MRWTVTVALLAALLAGCFEEQVRLVVKSPAEVEVTTPLGTRIEPLPAPDRKPSGDGFVFMDPGVMLGELRVRFPRRGLDDEWIATYGAPAWSSGQTRLIVPTAINHGKNLYPVRLSVPDYTLCTLEERTRSTKVTLMASLVGGSTLGLGTELGIALDGANQRAWLPLVIVGGAVLGLGVAAAVLDEKPHVVERGDCHS
jgi:hypothetical protein